MGLAAARDDARGRHASAACGTWLLALRPSAPRAGRPLVSLPLAELHARARRAPRPGAPPARATAARAFAAGAALAAVAALGGCAPAERGHDVAARAAGPSAGTSGAMGVDDFGDSVRAPARPPARVVSLNPTTTELLFALGAGGRVVGRTRWDVYPDSARRVPDLGDGLRPNVEAVLAARPDLVVLYAGADNRDAARAFRAAGVPVVALKIDRVAEFAAAARLLGRVVGDSARGATVADTVLATVARVRRATAGRPRPRALWPLFDEPLYVAGGGSFLSELLDAAGADNVFADLPAPSPQVSREEVLRRGADVVVTGTAGAARLRREPAWRGLAAVRDGRIVVADSSLVLRPGVKLGEAAAMLAERLHPGALGAAPRAERPDPATCARRTGSSASRRSRRSASSRWRGARCRSRRARCSRRSAVAATRRRWRSSATSACRASRSPRSSAPRSAAAAPHCRASSGTRSPNRTCWA
jgi:ABC-type Fe3+-hydroxamate transport system substrate-binding protein